MVLFFTNSPNNQFKLKWLPCLLLWQLRRYTEWNNWRHCNWESRHCAHFSPVRVSVHCHSIGEMILHYEKGENLCGIYDTGKRDTIAYMSPGCPYLLWLHCMFFLHVLCNSFKCACLFSGVTRLTYSTAFYFLFSAANNLELQSFR